MSYESIDDYCASDGEMATVAVENNIPIILDWQNASYLFENKGLELLEKEEW